MARFERRKEDRPDEIIEAAFSSFAEKGYADTKVEQVAKRAGVSKGLIYLYFKTKEELFKAVVRRVVVPRLSELDARIADHQGTVTEFFRGPFVDTAVALVNSPVRYIVRLLIAEGPKHPDLTEFYYREVISHGMQTLSALVKKGVDQGEFRNAALAQHPQLIIAPTMIGVVWKTLFDSYHELEVRAMFETHVDTLLRALTDARSHDEIGA